MPQRYVNPLSMIPKREDLPEGRSLKDIVNSLHPEIREPVKEVGNLAKLGYDVATGEDVEGLPFGVEMIPGVSLVAKLQQGKTPGLLDFIDIPSFKGLGALKAMPPIVGTLKELKEGGRLGKSLRNIEKAKNPVFKMYHRTDIENIPSIMREGLLASPPDKGVHTFMENNLPNMVWLSRTPEAPVLTDKTRKYPRTVGHVEVVMPKSEYEKRRQIIDNRWRNLPNDNRDFVPISRGSKFDNVTIFPDDVDPSHLRDVSKEYWAKQEYPLKVSLMAQYGGVDGRGTLGELENRLRTQTTKIRHDAVKAGNVKSWKPGELPVLNRNKYLGTVSTKYSPAEQKRRASVYDKFYGTERESHPDIMRKLYYEASPKDKRNIMKYLKQDYLDDWIPDEEWFDFDDDMLKEYQEFLKRLETGEEFKNYWTPTGFED